MKLEETGSEVKCNSRLKFWNHLSFVKWGIDLIVCNLIKLDRMFFWNNLWKSIDLCFSDKKVEDRQKNLSHKAAEQTDMKTS